MKRTMRMSRRLIALIWLCAIERCSAFNLNIKEEVYLGCYLGMEPISATTVDSVKECNWECRPGYIMGIKNGELCVCGKYFGMRVASSRCDKKCPDDDKSCGGQLAFSVYAIRSRANHMFYQRGCFERKNDHIGETFGLRTGISRAKCMYHCYKNDSNGMMCVCAKSFRPFTKVSDEECNIVCSKKDDSFCGGQEYFSLYEAKFKYNFAMHEPHCLEELLYNGTCDSEGCMPGWTGPSCDYRDCSENNGGCPLNLKCEYQTVNKKRFAECICKPGFYANGSFCYNVSKSGFFRKSAAAVELSVQEFVLIVLIIFQGGFLFPFVVFGALKIKLLNKEIELVRQKKAKPGDQTKNPAGVPNAPVA